MSIQFTTITLSGITYFESNDVRGNNSTIWVDGGNEFITTNTAAPRLIKENTRLSKHAKALLEIMREETKQAEEKKTYLVRNTTGAVTKTDMPLESGVVSKEVEYIGYDFENGEVKEFVRFPAMVKVIGGVDVVVLWNIYEIKGAKEGSMVTGEKYTVNIDFDNKVAMPIVEVREKLESEILEVEEITTNKTVMTYLSMIVDCIKQDNAVIGYMKLSKEDQIDMLISYLKPLQDKIEKIQTMYLTQPDFKNTIRDMIYESLKNPSECEKAWKI